jgi:hypothetical protein
MSATPVFVRSPPGLSSADPNDKSLTKGFHLVS